MFELKPANVKKSALITRTASVADSAKWTLTAAVLNEDGTVATPAVMTNQAFFVDGDITIIEAHEADGKQVARQVIQNPTPVANLVEALHVGVTGTRFGFIDANEPIDLKENHRTNWLLRSRQSAFGNRSAVSGAGFGWVVCQTIDGQDYETFIRLDQSRSVIEGKRILVQGQVPIISVRTRTQVVLDDEGLPMFENGEPMMETIQLPPSDIVSAVPTWEELEGTLVSLRGANGKSEQYFAQDVLNYDLAVRQAEYAKNHQGETLDKSAYECMVFAISTNHYYSAEEQPIYNAEGQIVGRRGPGDIRHNSGDWHVAKAGLSFGVRGPVSQAWLGFISASDLCKATCGMGLKEHFVPRRALQGQTYRNNTRTSTVPALVPAGNLVAAEGEQAF